jgi:phosphohistidine phosphatase
MLSALRGHGTNCLDMKTLYLVRHAKSSRDDPMRVDRDRPLNERGNRDAPKMGKRLAKCRATPDLILSSPARRALATAEIIARKLDYERSRIVVDDRLYGVGVDAVLTLIRRLDDSVGCAMLVGHNPELTELAHRLSGKIVHLPTCAVAEFTFDTNRWARIGTDAPTTAALDCPGES